MTATCTPAPAPTRLLPGARTARVRFLGLVAIAAMVACGDSPVGPTRAAPEQALTQSAPPTASFSIRVEAQSLDNTRPLSNHPVVVGADTLLTNAAGIATLVVAPSSLNVPRDVFVPGTNEFFPARVRALASGQVIRLMPKSIRMPNCSDTFRGQSAELRLGDAATGPGYDGGPAVHPHNLAYFRNYDAENRTRKFFNPRWAVSRIPFAFSPEGPSFTAAQKEQIRGEIGALLGSGICDTFFEVPFVSADQYGLVIQAVDALPQGGAGMLEHLIVDEKSGAILNALVSLRLLGTTNGAYVQTRTPAHEAAHALGVGHTDKWTSVMSSGVNSSVAYAPTLDDAAHYVAFKNFSRGGALVNAMNALYPDYTWEPFWDTQESVAAATAAAVSYGRGASASNIAVESVEAFMAKSERTGVAKISLGRDAH